MSSIIFGLHWGVTYFTCTIFYTSLNPWGYISGLFNVLSLVYCYYCIYRDEREVLIEQGITSRLGKHKPVQIVWCNIWWLYIRRSEKVLPSIVFFLTADLPQIGHLMLQRMLVLTSLVFWNPTLRCFVRIPPRIWKMIYQEVSTWC